MRIISGKLGARHFEAPHGHHTHPMGDRVRGGLFNTLGDVEGLTVLDAFAGSGALSFEAVSRGATSALAIENDKNAQRAIASNIATLGLNDQVQLIKAAVGSWLSTNPGREFDLVLCDPPYNDLQRDLLLQRLAMRVRPNGVFVLSWPGQEKPPELPGLTLLRAHRYGDAQLIFWRAEEA